MINHIKSELVTPFEEWVRIPKAGRKDDESVAVDHDDHSQHDNLLDSG